MPAMLIYEDTRQGLFERQISCSNYRKNNFYSISDDRRN